MTREDSATPKHLGSRGTQEREEALPPKRNSSQRTSPMAFKLTQTLINSPLVSGNMKPGNEIALRIDQALLQDVLGTLVMLELEAMRVERGGIDRAVQYVDHNLLETDNLNGDEHLFLRS